VDDAMADIACLFHWPLADLAELSLNELLHWREQARLRSGNDKSATRGR
jgi:hypothetical protein